MISRNETYGIKSKQAQLSVGINGGRLPQKRQGVLEGVFRDSHGSGQGAAIAVGKDIVPDGRVGPYLVGKS